MFDWIYNTSLLRKSEDQDDVCNTKTALAKGPVILQPHDNLALAIISMAQQHSMRLLSRIINREAHINELRS